MKSNESALLLSRHFKIVIRRLQPSIPPAIIKLHLINLWFLSMCQRWFGSWTLYTRLLRQHPFPRSFIPLLSTRCRLSLSLYLCMCIPLVLKIWPRKLSPQKENSTIRFATQMSSSSSVQSENFNLEIVFCDTMFFLTPIKALLYQIWRNLQKFLQLDFV